VRFGNVLGSRGSVLHTFTAQIDRGGPVTVTDPDVTRFFMTVPEACQLVIQAGAIGRPGEALVLDMGEPVNIADMARRMIAMSGKPVEVVFTGLRHGEELHEELFGDGERGVRPLHPMISHVAVPPLDPDQLKHQPWARAVSRGKPAIPVAISASDPVLAR
jgi:FlaA1/EpsC-like NDP-sugar epimerase